MIELYRRNIWNDAKTVNVIKEALFSKFIKVIALAYSNLGFLGENFEFFSGLFA